MSSPPSRLAWLPALLVGLCGVWAFCGPALLDPLNRLATGLYTEGPGHLWGLWLGALDVPEHGGLVRTSTSGWPGFFQSHLMDPINLVVFAPVFWLAGADADAAALAWNALHAAAPLVGAWSVWRLAVRLLGRTHVALPWAAMLGAIALVLSPYYLSYPLMGRTEYLPAVLYPWHLALLHEWMRRPRVDDVGDVAPAPGVGVGVSAGAVLGAAALGGWYLAVFLALASVVFAVAWSRRLPLGEALGRLGFVALVAVPITFPAAWALVSFGMPVDVTGLVSEPVRCVSVAQLVRMVPSDDTPRLDYEPYIGLVPLLACAVAAALRPRREWVWFGAAGLTLSFAVGANLSFGTEVAPDCGRAMAGPLAVVRALIPPLRAMRSWSRIMVVASAVSTGALIVLVGAAAPKLRRALGPITLLVGGLMVADQATYPVRVPWVPDTFTHRPPPRFADALATLPPGPVLTYPIDVRLRFSGLEEHGLWNLWFLDRDRPMSAGALGARDATESYAVLTQEVSEWAVTTAEDCGGRGDRAAVRKSPPDVPFPDMDLEDIRASAVNLLLRGYVGAIAVEDMEGGGNLRVLLGSALGPPAFDEDGVLAWDLRQMPLEHFAGSFPYTPAEPAP